MALNLNIYILYIYIYIYIHTGPYRKERKGSREKGSVDISRLINEKGK